MAMVTVAYVLFSSFTALFLDSLYTVVAMTGALGGSLIEAIIPAGLYIKYVKEIQDVDAPWKTIAGWVVIALGAVIAVLGTYESLTQYFCFFEYIRYLCKKIDLETQNNNSYWRILTCYRNKVLASLRIFLGSVLVAASFFYFVYRECSLGLRLSPSYQYVKNAV